MNEKIENYLHSLIPPREGLFAEIEQYAKDGKVPIMEPEGIEALLQIIRLSTPKAILEVGTAIGYSALRMAEAAPGAKIVTIERDQERIDKAKEYIQKAGKQDQIILLEGDALETAGLVKEHSPFDAIFIDAAKGQYGRFFELYEVFLQSNGIIVTDNVLFKGLVAEEEAAIEPKRIRSLVRKIKKYNAWVMAHPNYDTVILPIGDGVAISKHKGERV
ncbi:O-methyltransferase [Peribacillus cavernae]|uniref:tRNA 5-hydroxyuridine methyltransferase n=1 Tax=Peribacillus cavernae TaxID=1674310 RepID=A0A3S0U7S0_9BACI|nr:O-methyltransferase [Peribacillus cavernae]MDQ0218207.1 putative O-methyltransferase YrrM [Peribacillus cavernae]RUQ32652.1 O-methyltransferase [Peribacillus cavernae]